MCFTPFHSSASGGASFFSVMTGHSFASSALSATYSCRSSGTSSSAKMASAGHSGSHSVQSMHSSGLFTRKFGPSCLQSTGHTSTHSVYLHLTQLSTTTNVIGDLQLLLNAPFAPRAKPRATMLIGLAAGGEPAGEIYASVLWHAIAVRPGPSR